ncbi:MAG: glycosyltransferase [Oxalobacteraceae bacterium]|nr:MAG: glycosyltransferase [Oxalobacteraceae bacterium]
MAGLVGQITLSLIALLLAVPAAILLAQVVLALLPARANTVPAGATRPRIALLVPAHNESIGLIPTLGQALQQMRAGDRLLVVADNCDDDTAEVARRNGAEVAERFSTEHRGKGYALDHGVRVLSANPPDVVVVLDADCTFSNDCIDRIATLAHASGRPVQARYLMRAPDGGLKARVAEFAMRVKNWVRPRGMQRISLGCGLYGTGMAFPWSVAAVAPLASGHLAEDMQLGVRLAESGTPPLFCEEASVFSVFAASREGEKSQRTRWEHGHLSLLLNDGPRLLGGAVKHARLRLALLILDMLVPPLALLMMVQVGCCALALLGWALFGWRVPAGIALPACVSLITAIALARTKFASDIITWADMVKAPTYVLGKIPMYVRYVVRRQVEWVRTKRD